MSAHRKQRLFLPAMFALLLLAAMLVLLKTPVASSQETDESLLEQELARTAELNPPQSMQPLPQAVQAAQYPLFVGVDDVAIPTYSIDPSTNISATEFSGYQIWGAAYDPASKKVYFNSGSQLYEWTDTGVINLLGTIVDGGAATQTMVSLAFHNGQLFGTKNIANEAVWLINPATAVATVSIDYVDGDYDFGGLAFDPTTGDLYGTNDDSLPHGAGLFRIEPGGTATLIAPYPAGQTDIDGLAISADRIAYLIPDQPGFIYVYDLVTNTYLPPLTNPWATSEVFSGGAYVTAGSGIACSVPALAVPDNNPTGVSDSLTYDGSFHITDLDVQLDMSHGWVGDLVFTLTHEDTGTGVVLVDRPGVPAATFGCSGNDINATIDDEGADGPVENTCLVGPPTLAGSLVGGDPPDPALLSAFDGEDLSGIWTLTVSDNAGGDTGTLNSWCLVGEGGQPEISVVPSSLESIQPPETQVTHTLTISNSGAAPLNWAALEETSAPPPVLPALPANAAPATNGAFTSLAEHYASGVDASVPAAAAPVPRLQPSAPAAGPIYYSTRTAFEAVFPGLPLEDFEDGLWGNGAVLPCPAPANATTNNPCFTPGAILPGVSFQDDPLNDAGGDSVNGLAGVGAGVFGATSKNIVANTYTNTFQIYFDPPVNVAGMDLMHYFSSPTPVMIALYDDADTLIASTTALGSNTGDFWGVYSITPIARVDIQSTAGAGDGAEGVDNIAFGAADLCDPLDDIPWVSVDPITGTVPAGSSTPLDVTFDSAGLAEGSYHGALCLSNNDPQNPLVRVPLTMTVALPSITLSKTVGLDPATCATETTLHIDDASSADVTYCYRIFNTSPYTLTIHDLVDDQLGPILTNFAYSLVPGASAYLTQTASLTDDTINVATWTASSALITSVSASATATVTIGTDLYLPFFARHPAPTAPVTSWGTSPVAALLQQRE